MAFNKVKMFKMKMSGLNINILWNFKNGWAVKLIFLILVLAVQTLIGQQNLDKKIVQNRTLLENLEEQINSLKKNIRVSRKKEKSILQKIALLDKEKALISRSKGILQQQRDLISQKIEHTNLNLKNAEQRYQHLKALYAQRAVYAYKYGKTKPAQLILQSSSLNQALIRYRYLKLIADHDKRMLTTIKKKKDEIREIRQKLKTELDRKRATLSKLHKRENDYNDRKNRKKSLLKKINWDQSKYQQRLAGKKKEKKNLIQLLLELERERKKTEKQESGPEKIRFKFKNFRRAKGKLPWPVKGRIITHYGKQRDAKSKTYIKNTDIEIKSRLGTPVHCVFSGVVRIITYLPGYGNTIIVEHGNGYYTVYAHLAEIYVHKGSVVQTNAVIATVGDSGSLAGAKLQFGIYGGKSIYNPEKWLRKN